MVHANPDNVKTKEEQGEFGRSVRKWTESKVAHHKFLRGGESDGLYVAFFSDP